MGYELYITRAVRWSATDGREIAADEWARFVEGDSQLQPAPDIGPYFVLWRNPAGGDQGWLDWSGGNIFSKHPDDALVEKMASIAKRLKAKVQGEDGETYAGATELTQFMWSLQALAGEARVQLELFESVPRRAKKLWLEFERGREWLLARRGAELTEGQITAVDDVRQKLDAMTKEDERLWTDEALRTDSRWETIREAAKDTLDAFGWTCDAPPSAW